MGTRLYVENLSDSVTREGLTELFSQAGKVDSVTLVIDPSTTRCQGHGFIEMGAEPDAKAAITKFNGMLFEGKKLTVTQAGPAQRQASGFRGGLSRGERRNR